MARALERVLWAGPCTLRISSGQAEHQRSWGLALSVDTHRGQCSYLSMLAGVCLLVSPGCQEGAA